MSKILKEAEPVDLLKLQAYLKAVDLSELIDTYRAANIFGAETNKVLQQADTTMKEIVERRNEVVNGEEEDWSAFQEEKEAVIAALRAAAHAATAPGSTGSF